MPTELRPIVYHHVCGWSMKMVSGSKSFTFQTTRSVLCEVGATAKIGEIMAGRGCRKVAFVTDALILKLGLAEPALASLRAAGIDVWIFDEVIADPPEAMILARRHGGPGAGRRWRRLDRRRQFARHRKADRRSGRFRSDDRRHLRDRTCQGRAPAAGVGANHRRHRLRGHPDLNRHHRRL